MAKQHDRGMMAFKAEEEVNMTDTHTYKYTEIRQTDRQVTDLACTSAELSDECAMALKTGKKSA